MRVIETEFGHYFVDDDDGNLVLNEGVDLAVAIDILEHPHLYMPSATQEQRLKRYSPGHRFAPNVGNPAYPSMPPVAWAYNWLVARAPFKGAR